MDRRQNLSSAFSNTCSTSIIAAYIAHVFLSYFVSLHRLYGFMHEGPLEHATAFGIVAFLTLVLWFCFGYFREQFCIIMCPYGRLQGALTDDDTVNVGYDEIRGEPRGTKGKAEGDCVDCHRCVQVCPTGIDIRNGLQLECIGCTACIDACDDVMTKIDRPERPDPLRFVQRLRRQHRAASCARASTPTARWPPLGLAALDRWWLRKRRGPSMPPFPVPAAAGFYSDATSVRNIYKIRVFQQAQPGRPRSPSVLARARPPGYQLSGAEQTFAVGALDEMSRTCVVIAPVEAYIGVSDIVLEVHADPGDVTLEKTVRFLGPNPQSLKARNP